MKRLVGIAAITFVMLQSCESGPWRIIHDPKAVEPVDPATLSFENIQRATDKEVGISVIDLRRVEGGVHVVIAVEIPSEIQKLAGYARESEIRSLSLDLEDAPPDAFELLDPVGEQVKLRPGKSEEINRPRSITVYRHHGTYGVPGSDRLYYREIRFRTEKTLPPGEYRIRAIPTAFPARFSSIPIKVSRDQRTFVPALFPPLPGQD